MYFYIIGKCDKQILKSGVFEQEWKNDENYEYFLGFSWKKMWAKFRNFEIILLLILAKWWLKSFAEM